ncbi:MAG: L,D-transpeptidase [Thermoleophilia bacterium]
MTRRLIKASVVAIVLVALAGAGYGVDNARSNGGGTGQPAAAVQASPGGSGTTAPSPTPVPRWQVAKAVGPVVAYRAPSTSAAVKQRFGKLNASNYPSVFLVRGVRQIGATTWYDVWLPIRPNESHGWVQEGSVAIYTTTAKIVIRLAERRLIVYRRGQVMGSFTVAVGAPALPTPRGTYYVNEKLRPPTSGGPYGVLALGISAFQPRLPNWPLGGPVAIHGTNQDSLIGQAVSHGCVRMHNADVLKVSAWVPTGSPVVIIN